MTPAVADLRRALATSPASATLAPRHAAARALKSIGDVNHVWDTRSGGFVLVLWTSVLFSRLFLAREHGTWRASFPEGGHRA